MASSTAQDATRKILEELLEKKQQIQKGASPITGSMDQQNTLPIAEVTAASAAVVPTATPTTSQRAVFQVSNSTTLGYFIPQDSHYGNTFIPVLPRFELTPAHHHTATK